VARDADAGRETSVRDAFSQYLIDQLEGEGLKIDERAMFAVAQQFEDWPTLTNLKNIAADFFRTTPHDPGPLHIELARCPFSLILTTCHDDLFTRALHRHNKSPSRHWYHYRGEPRDNTEISGTPSPNLPTVYHLFGTFDDPNSLVLSENDLLDFITAIISDRPKLPDSLRNALRNKTFLFVGFGVRYWYIRVILKLLIKTMGIPRGSFALESLGELEPAERKQTVLFYSRGTRVEIVDMDALAFAKELSDRLGKAGGILGAAAPQRKPIQVFISYERSDGAVAKRLLEALPKDRFEPWLDTDFLRAGEEWNQELEDKIRDSDYFLVLNSSNIAAKKVGYVNKELSIALDMQKYRQRGTGFVIPLQVEGISAEYGQPDLKRFQQIPLRLNSFADDVGLIAKTIFRDHQLRER